MMGMTISTTARATRLALAAAAGLLLLPAPLFAGPPYLTDDPEPVPYRHWEFYLATQPEITRDGATGTAPHIEVNYGAVPDLQLHVLAPLAFARPTGGKTNYGPGDLELGAKYRFVEERDFMPMVGTFPLVEIPLGDEARGLGTGHLHGFVPLWLQKSAGPWTTYGGVGYWFNPGPGNRGYWYVGWLVQRSLAERASLGAEIYYTTADRSDGSGNLRFNIGLVLDFTPNHHLLVSAGRSIAGDTRLQGYLAYLLTL